MYKTMDSHDLALKLKSLIIFRPILEDEVMENFLFMLESDVDDEEEVVNNYCDFAAALLARNPNFTEYLADLLMDNENAFTRHLSANRGKADSYYEELLNRELDILNEAGAFDGEEFRRIAVGLDLPGWQISDLDIHEEYRRHLAVFNKKGFGIYAKYHFFTVDDEGKIVPVTYPDPQKIENLYGYERERKQVIDNTLAFLKGLPANNVLLYGDAGTGKSSTVKAIVNNYYTEGLRLVEIKKNQFYSIPPLLEELANNPLKFIFFIDDLSFTADDGNFAVLKAILEGGVNGHGNNILFYVTTNRRLLVKQSFSERQGDDIHRGDTLQENASLSARFGLKVTFERPEPKDFAVIVKELAGQYGVTMAGDELKKKAEAYALRNGGRSPRAAKQFIELLKAEVIK